MNKKNDPFIVLIYAHTHTHPYMNGEILSFGFISPTIIRPMVNGFLSAHVRIPLPAFVQVMIVLNKGKYILTNEPNVKAEDCKIIEKRKKKRQVNWRIHTSQTLTIMDKKEIRIAIVALYAHSMLLLQNQCVSEYSINSMAYQLLSSFLPLQTLFQLSIEQYVTEFRCHFKQIEKKQNIKQKPQHTAFSDTKEKR